MKPWIENISLDDVRKGYHYDPGFNSMLIQIVDPDTDFPDPAYQFKDVRKFKFLDVEGNETKDGEKLVYADSITNEDAKGIAEALQHAWNEGMNVVVHCHMGVCRSGAVAEVGSMLGFRDTEKYRVPNLLVKHKVMHYLGLV